MLLDGSTHACSTHQCGGGVGRNIAEALWRLRGGRAKLVTAIGNDADGTYLRNIAPGLILDGSVIKGGRTPTYAAMMDTMGECLIGLGDMNLHNEISIDLVNRNIDVIRKAPMVVLDGNAPKNTINHVLEICEELGKPVFFEPTDRRKAVRASLQNHKVTFASPNFNELRAMANLLQPNKLTCNKFESLNSVLELGEIVIDYIDCIIVTLGSKGVLVVRKSINEKSKYTSQFYPVNKLEKVENVSGAGDCFNSGFIHGVLTFQNESQCIQLGFNNAKLSLMSKNAVPSNLNSI